MMIFHLTIDILTNDENLVDGIMKTLRNCNNNKQLKEILIDALKLNKRAASGPDDLEITIRQVSIQDRKTGKETVHLCNSDLNSIKTVKRVASRSVINGIVKNDIDNDSDDNGNGGHNENVNETDQFIVKKSAQSN